jgi:hypothetical protein
MVEFNTFEFKNGQLNIVISVEANAYYINTYLKRIVVTTSDSLGDGSTMPTYSHEEGADNSDIIYDSESGFDTGGTKQVTINNSTLYIKQNPVSFKDKLLVVWVMCDYNVGTEIPPCGGDEELTIGILYDRCPIINEIVKTSKEVERPCGIPKSFIDTLLRYAALNYAILAKDWERVIKFWNKFYTKIGKHITTKCGCHG